MPHWCLIIQYSSVPSLSISSAFDSWDLPAVPRRIVSINHCLMSLNDKNPSTSLDLHIAFGNFGVLWFNVLTIFPLPLKTVGVM